jgi:hypothetical protein
MVNIKYNGRLGNRMFQYALGRYLATEMGYCLNAAPLPFLATRDKISGNEFTYPEQVLYGQFCNVPAILKDKTSRAIILDGYFQQSRMYLPFMDRIIVWFKMDDIRAQECSAATDSDLLVYIRLGDYYRDGHSLNNQFYEKVIEIASPRKIFIATDEPGHPFLNQFSKYKPTILLGTRRPIEDLAIAKLFNKIAISCSTFSWWAAILSNASQVYFPIDEVGHWSRCNHQTIEMDSIDLRVDDPRFIYFYNCPTIKSNRISPNCLPLSDAVPFMMCRHLKSRAYWFK